MAECIRKGTQDWLVHDIPQTTFTSVADDKFITLSLYVSKVGCSYISLDLIYFPKSSSCPTCTQNQSGHGAL